MSFRPVFADATSRLHADIAIMRLIRAGIPEEHLSAVFSPRQAPNSVYCWMKDFSAVPETSSCPTAAAGLLGKILRHGFEGAAVKRVLESLGFNERAAKHLQETVEEGGVVVCVHARTESEAAAAWHVFRHVGMENITLPAESELGMERPPMLSAQRADLAA